MQIIEVRNDAQFAEAKRLIEEYARLPHIAGRWRDPAKEIAALPGDHMPTRQKLNEMYDNAGDGVWDRVAEMMQNIVNEHYGD